MTDPKWLVARGDVTRKVSATQERHLFRTLQRSASHWAWVFAPNKEAALWAYNRQHPVTVSII